jgi:hypothetical protein
VRSQDLRDYPSYWAALGLQLTAITALVQSGDTSLYEAYWQRRIHYSEAEAKGHAQYVKELAKAIKRGEDVGPTRVVLTKRGNPLPYDGSHRACIRHAIGLPIPFVVK